MNLPTEWVAVAAALALLLGLLLVIAGGCLRRSRGLGEGRTVALDNITLSSCRLGLTGRVDRLLREGGTLIPEEWKSARVLRPHHLSQLGVYFLLVEQELRAWVLELAARIRAANAEVMRPIPVSPWPGQCRPCGMRGHCSQARP
jgi:hypothetical protein